MPAATISVMGLYATRRACGASSTRTIGAASSKTDSNTSDGEISDLGVVQIASRAPSGLKPRSKTSLLFHVRRRLVEGTSHTTTGPSFVDAARTAVRAEIEACHCACVLFELFEDVKRLTVGKGQNSHGPIGAAAGEPVAFGTKDKSRDRSLISIECAHDFAVGDFHQPYLAVLLSLSDQVARRDSEPGFQQAPNFAADCGRHFPYSKCEPHSRSPAHDHLPIRPDRDDGDRRGMADQAAQ